MIITILICLTILTLVGCKSVYLRDDFLSSAIDSNYYSADLIIEGNNYKGISLVKAQDHEPFIFYVAGIYNGYINIKSNDCNIDQSKSYKNSALTSFVVDLKENDRCLISVNVFPQFEKEIANGFKWKSVKGLIAIKKEKYKQFNYQSYQVTKHIHILFPFSAEQDNSRVFIKGCGFKFDKTFNKGSHLIKISSNDLDFNSTCILEGFIKNKIQDESVTILVTNYELGFRPLPEPHILFKNNKIEILADSNVSFISLGSQFLFSNVGELKLEEPEVIIRLYSIKGRTLSCKINKEVKALSCFR